MKIVLASSSPRRQQLLELIGLTFTIVVSQIEEDNAKDLPPHELAIGQARDKAMDVSKQVAGDAVVIGADTIVVLDGKVFGKPVDRQDAVRMLTALAGREHTVICRCQQPKLSDMWIPANRWTKPALMRFKGGEHCWWKALMAVIIMWWAYRLFCCQNY